MEDDDGFQLNTVKRKKKNGGAVRLYLGGLPVNNDNSNGEIEQANLRKWLQEHLPDGTEVGAIELKHGSKNAKKPSSFALVECSGANGINDVIRILKQNSGCVYNGSKMTIQREQRSGNKNNNKVRQRSGNNYTGKRQFGFKNKPGGNTSSGGASLASKGWSKPASMEEEPPSEIENEWSDIWNEQEQQQELRQKPITSIDEASERIASVVSKEIAMAKTVDDKINAAIASTAATTMMTSVMASLAFGSQGTNDDEASANPITDFSSYAKEQSMQSLLDDFGEEDPDWKEKVVDEEDHVAAESSAGIPSMKGNDFATFVRGQSMAGLLEDFGEADPDWKNKIVEEESDAPATKQLSASSTPSAKGKDSNGNSNVSRLAMKGRAPIHLSIESFGFVHGAPSRKSRDRSGSPYTQPMGLLSVGDDVTEPVPTHLEFHDGLRSGVIKRMLKSAPLATSSIETTCSSLDAYDRDEEDTEPDLSSYKDFFDYCNRYLAEFRIYPSLVDAIHEGGHGYVSPLTMNFQIGSHLGRHRSVVAVEKVAQHLRSLLRANKDGKITCSVSVGTVHRDVNKRIPNKIYKEDDEDRYDKNGRI
ncbi:unnamed protein product [Pseudo-nitzschia multistriata]|uniref:Uncharacterized protein n=1 Tax=Pseudo-nitzschia multistriata TaxID=183589 RepID=A0A448ZFK2_9STRA|nr:unnamed protein product [Pseudo-nitzschia multistriata]